MSFLDGGAGSGLINVGIYTLPQAAVLVRLPLATVDAVVADGPNKNFPPHQFPLAVTDPDAALGEPVITFQGLMSLWVASELRDEGIPWLVIRYAAFQASNVLKSNHPLALGSFRTDGRRIFLSLEQHEGRLPKTAVDLLSRQQVFEDVIERSLSPKIVIRGRDGRIQKWFPLGRRYSVVLDPERRFGEPIDPDTGIPTASIAEAYHSESGNLQKAANWFGTSAKAVRDAVAFEKWLNRQS